MKWRIGIWLASAALLLAGHVDAQNMRRECASAVSQRYRVSRNDVQVSDSGSSRRGESVLTWSYGRSRNGYCVMQSNGRVREVGEGSYRGQGSGWDNDNDRRNRGRSNDNRNRGGRPGGDWGSGNNVNVPQVSVDTSGRGNYSDGGSSVQITRGWVNTKSSPTVSLSGKNNFRIDFYGNITRQNGDREFTMRVTGSSRGNASGTLTFRLNSDRNEVEYINMSGRLGGRNVNGSFNR